MKIYFFRGKAATGKTTISNLLSKEINCPILRKDDIFDSISKIIEDNEIKHNISYEVLKSLLQKNIDSNIDTIIDVGLADNIQYTYFLSELRLENAKILNFYCDCSDLEIWKNRFIERLKNPTPNQYFTNVEEILNRYKNLKLELLPNEVYIDSIKDLNTIKNNIYKYIC